MESPGQKLVPDIEMATHTHHSIKTELCPRPRENTDMANHTHNLKNPNVFEFVDENLVENEPKLQETDIEMVSRISKEKTMFLTNTRIRQNKAATVKKRVSFKAKLNQEVVNRRHLKTCPICLCENKQMLRHLKTVHAHCSAKVLSEALTLIKVRQPREKTLRSSDKLVCPICNTLRSNLRSHLINAHSIQKGSVLIKELLVSKAEKPVNSKNNCVREWLLEYKKKHFNALDGACTSNKEATRVKIISNKLKTVGNMLDFLLPKSKECSIESVLAEIKQLFMRPDGYVWTRKGKYATLIHDIDCLKEFCMYARREGLASPLVVSNGVERLCLARKNAKKKQKREMAEFQEEDRKLVIGQSDIDAFLAAPLSVKAAKDLENSQVLKKRDAVNARNFVITKWILENSCRPSDLDETKVTQLEEAKKDPKRAEDGTSYYSICSTSSKNVESSGQPTYLLISDDMMKTFDSYLTKARPALATLASEDSVFIKENGEPMVHDNISQGYRSRWHAAAKSNPKIKAKANSRHFRHSANGIAKLCGSQKLKETVHIGTDNRIFFSFATLDIFCINPLKSFFTVLLLNP